MTTTPQLTTPLTAPPSRRVLRICAAFGLSPAPALSPPPLHAGDILRTLRPGDLALLTGPSGSGKSTTLRALSASLATRAIDARDQLRQLLASDSAVIDSLIAASGAQADFDSALRALSIAGLAEPVLWTRPASELSDGQRARLAIAACLLRAAHHPGSWILIDECCAGLDDLTARNVARTLSRWTRRQQLAVVVCASTREQLSRWLSPDRTWRYSL